MRENPVAEKSFDFAIHIVNLRKYLIAEKGNTFSPSSLCEAEPASVPMWPRPNGPKVRRILLRR